MKTESRRIGLVSGASLLAACAILMSGAASASPAGSDYRGWLFESGVIVGDEFTEKLCFATFDLPVAADLSWTLSLTGEVCYGRTTTETGRVPNNFPPYAFETPFGAQSTQPLVSAGGNLYEFFGENVEDGVGQGEDRFGTILSSASDDSLLLVGSYNTLTDDAEEEYLRFVHALVRSTDAIQTARTAADLEGTSWRLARGYQGFFITNGELGIATIHSLTLDSNAVCTWNVSSVVPEFSANGDVFAIVQTDNGVDFDSRFVRGGPDVRDRTDCTWSVGTNGDLVVTFTLTRAVDPGSPVTLTQRFAVSDDNRYLTFSASTVAEENDGGQYLGFRAADALAIDALDGSVLFHLSLTEFGADGNGAAAAGPFGDRPWQEFEAMARGAIEFDSTTSVLPPAGEGGDWYACDMQLVFSVFEHEMTGSATTGTVELGTTTNEAVNVLFDSCAFQLAPDGGLSVHVAYAAGGLEGLTLRGYVNDSGEVLGLVAQEIEGDPANPGNEFKDLANVWLLLGMTYTGDLDADTDGDGNSNLREFQMPLPLDADGDGIFDAEDNCATISNPGQQDSNGDGFGNACDADFNGDCLVNFLDLGLLRSNFFTMAADQDLNSDGVVNFTDLGLFRALFFQPPGPNGSGECTPDTVEVTFSYSNTDGTVPGTVTGRILGLADNVTGQPAVSVLIDSFPPQLAGVLDEGNDAALWTEIRSNSFTISNGEVTSFSFVALTGGVDGEVDFLCLANQPNKCSGSDTVAAFGLANPTPSYVRSFQPGAVQFTVTPDL